MHEICARKLEKMGKRKAAKRHLKKSLNYQPLTMTLYALGCIQDSDDKQLDIYMDFLTLAEPDDLALSFVYYELSYLFGTTGVCLEYWS